MLGYLTSLGIALIVCSMFFGGKLIELFPAQGLYYSFIAAFFFFEVSAIIILFIKEKKYTHESANKPYVKSTKSIIKEIIFKSKVFFTDKRLRVMMYGAMLVAILSILGNSFYVVQLSNLGFKDKVGLFYAITIAVSFFGPLLEDIYLINLVD